MKTLNYFLIAALAGSFACSETNEPLDEVEVITIVVDDFTFTVNENVAAGTELGKISVTTNATELAFALANEVPAGALTIDSEDGTISIADPDFFNWEENESVSAEVVVSSGDVQGSAYVTVSIANLVELSIDDFTTTIDEHPINGTLLGELVYTNASSGAIGFALLSESPEGALEIDNDGKIKVKSGDLFEFSAYATILADVRLTVGSDFDDATVTINLNEVEEEVLVPIDLSLMEFFHMGANNPFLGVDAGNDSYPSFVDLDKDGDLDLVVGSLEGTFAFAENRSGTFIIQVGTLNPFDGLDVGSDSRHTFADVDGDGDQDLISGADNGALKYFEFNNGFSEKTGTSNPFSSISTSLDSKPAFSDVDGDGDQDLVAAGFNGAFRYFRNESGTFVEKSGSDNPFGAITSNTHAYPVFVDLDNDGDDDIVSGKYAGTYDYYVNDNGTYALSTATYPFNSLNSGTYSSPAFIDIDSDGDWDMVSGNSTGTIACYQLKTR